MGNYASVDIFWHRNAKNFDPNIQSIQWLCEPCYNDMIHLYPLDIVNSHKHVRAYIKLKWVKKKVGMRGKKICNFIIIIIIRGLNWNLSDNSTETLIHTVWHWFLLAHSWLHSYSFSLFSMKSWILLIFSSCWSRRSMMMPMGVFFSPTPSILFSSLFFMLRSLKEAWIKITTG